jgi:multiple sugar transport system permease protein
VAAGLAYTVGAVLAWTGWGLAAWVAYLIGRAIVARESIVRASIFLPAAAGAACFFLSRFMAPNPEAGWRLPIFWVVLPFTAWTAIGCFLMAGSAALGLTGCLTPEEKKAKGNQIFAWVVAAAAFGWLYFADPDRVRQVVKGSIPFSFQTAVLVILLLLAGALAMGLSAKAVRTRRFSRTVLIQIGLLAGSFVFSVPFFFLLVTSFKEERDMSSANGIIWIPKVQQTVPYMDPKNPLYEANFNGQTVQATVTEKLTGGRVRMDVYKPFSIRGTAFEASESTLKEIPWDAALVTATVEGIPIKGEVIENMEDGRKRVLITEPQSLAQQQRVFTPAEVEPIRKPGLRWQNYTEALGYMPTETQGGWLYLRNTLIVVLLSVIGTLVSSSIVAYAFSRMRFPWRDQLFGLLLGTMMLPGAVTMLPKFLIFRTLGWVDTLTPLWITAFFSSAFNVFMLRQFFRGIPMELEDAAKMDGCTYFRTFWSIMLPQIKPALSVIFIWTFTSAWNDFQGPLIYINSPEHMPLSYALQLFSSDRSGEPGMMMAFATMTVVPVLALFFAMQRYFIEGVTLSGFGGR